MRTFGRQIAFKAIFLPPSTLSTNSPGAMSNRYLASLRLGDSGDVPVKSIARPPSAKLAHSYTSSRELAVFKGHFNQNTLMDVWNLCARSAAGSTTAFRRELWSSNTDTLGKTTVRYDDRSLEIRYIYDSRLDLNDFWELNAVRVSLRHARHCSTSIHASISHYAAFDTKVGTVLPRDFAMDDSIPRIHRIVESSVVSSSGQ